MRGFLCVYQKTAYEIISGLVGSEVCISESETMMWERDLPHDITDIPSSQELIQTMSAGIDPASRRSIFCENAGRLYGFLEN